MTAKKTPAAKKKTAPKKKKAANKEKSTRTKSRRIVSKSDHLIARTLGQVLDDLESSKTNEPGAKVLYIPEFCIVAKKLLKLGAVDRDLADFFGVTKQTIQQWKLRYPEFKKALEVSKKVANQNVKRSLYQTAIGYEFVAEVVEVEQDGKTIRKEIIKHQPPNVNAQKYWLNNRDPENWKEKRILGSDDDNPLIPPEIKIVYE